jgi:hypothetical protein
MEKVLPIDGCPMELENSCSFTRRGGYFRFLLLSRPSIYPSLMQAMHRLSKRPFGQQQSYRRIFTKICILPKRGQPPTDMVAPTIILAHMFDIVKLKLII